MDSGYLSAVAGLVGVTIGGLTSFGTAWFSQRAQLHEQRINTTRRKREALYVEFVKEAARLYADALSHESDDDVTDLVKLYAIASHIHMISSEPVIAAADAVIDAIIETYLGPKRSLHELKAFAGQGGLDRFSAFSRVSKADLEQYGSD